MNVGTDDAGSNYTEDRLANLAELVRLGREYLALDPSGGTAEFASWLRDTLDDTDAAGDAVEIVTFHAAKGLEWPVVHIAGLEKGYVPIHHAEDDPDALEEERRLLYVAITRAREELHCSWAQRRAFGSRSLRRSASPWLDDIRRGLGDEPSRAPGKPSARNKNTKASLRKQAGPADANRPLFQALRAWRKTQASAAGVPAYVVFNDATLTAVAEARPKSTAELLDLPGIGAVKAERFGPDLLRLVSEASAAPSR
ncbi:MAG: 3'-5' exonuclease [Microthrixaceae bacterium]